MPGRPLEDRVVCIQAKRDRPAHAGLCRASLLLRPGIRRVEPAPASVRPLFALEFLNPTALQRVPPRLRHLWVVSRCSKDIAKEPETHGGIRAPRENPLGCIFDHLQFAHVIPAPCRSDKLSPDILWEHNPRNSLWAGSMVSTASRRAAKNPSGSDPSRR